MCALQPQMPARLSTGTKKRSPATAELRFFFRDRLLLRCDAEDAPQSVIELEGRLRAVEIIARHAAWTARAVHWNSVHVIRRAMTLLGAFPLRERIVANLGRVVDVWLLLPDVTVNLEHVVARVAI